MMLASTVQFSRYGRSRASRALRRGDPVLAEFGPTCGRSLRTQQRARPRRLPGQLSVPLSEQPLARPPSGRTNRPGQLSEPNNQCSTNERPSPAHSAGNGPGRTSPITSASAPVAP
jgi:hypothetical protein